MISLFPSVNVTHGKGLIEICRMAWFGIAGKLAGNDGIKILKL